MKFGMQEKTARILRADQVCVQRLRSLVLIVICVAFLSGTSTFLRVDAFPTGSTSSWHSMLARTKQSNPILITSTRNLAGGTGVAPLFQIVQILLQDPTDTTRIQLLSINKKEDDLLMREEMDQLAKDYPDRFSVQYSLTEPPDDWKGLTGRGSVEMVRDTLPSPSSHETTSHNKNRTMILVCGRDDFVYTWSGPVVRAPPKADGTKGPKIQGPLLGILQDSGFDESEVFKY